jgi:hypothetical protein
MNGPSALTPDGFTFRVGVTTVVDAGCAGWRTFPIFKKQTIDRSQTRVLAFLNIVGEGMRGGPFEQNLKDMDAKTTGEYAKNNQNQNIKIDEQKPSSLHFCRSFGWSAVWLRHSDHQWGNAQPCEIFSIDSSHSGLDSQFGFGGVHHRDDPDRETRGYLWGQKVVAIAGGTVFCFLGRLRIGY